MIKTRWYRYHKLYCKRQTILYSSFLKHGVENHQFDIIEYCIADELNCSERFWQDIFNVISSNGLNGVLTVCGEKRYVASDKTRKRISESLKGDKHPAYGKLGALSPSFGKKASDETRKRQSEAKKGMSYYTHNDESKEKCRQAKLGKKNPMYGKAGSEHHNSKIVLCLVNGIYYESLVDGCLAMNLKYNYTSDAVRENKSEYFIYIENFFEKITIESNKRRRVKDKVTDIKYKNVTEASKALDIPRGKLSKMLNGTTINTSTLIFI